MKSLDIELPIWNQDGIALCGGTYTEFRHYAMIKHKYALDDMRGAVGYTHFEAGSIWLLWVADKGNVGALAHECLHITIGVLDALGFQLNDGSEEAYTYTQQYLLETILEAKNWRKVRY